MVILNGTFPSDVFSLVFFFEPSSGMTTQTESSPRAPSAQMIGDAFVEQYYHILHRSPELVYRFYQDASMLSRPDLNGDMKTVTTMKVSQAFIFITCYISQISELSPLTPLSFEYSTAVPLILAVSI